MTEKHGQFLEQLEIARKKVLERVTEEKDRKAVIGRLVDDNSFGFFVEHGASQWQTWADGTISKA